ncbi:mucin-7-like [Solenopsis invicta]|uniref:mucin-7-like n=1 Tax=Solenopsis invicta TaxID=13686 RepID=UPI00193E34A5|nr:mucin-7-like [Solenopsis invicta]
MGLLPAPRGAERPKAPPTAGKIARQSGVAPQKGAGNAVAVAARPALTTQREATPSILELWTEVVSKKTRKKAAKAAERATKTAPPPAARPTRVLPIPPPKPTPQQPSSKKKKKRGGRGGGQGGPGGQTPSGASSTGPARAAKIRPPTTAAVTPIMAISSPRLAAEHPRLITSPPTTSILVESTGQASLANQRRLIAREDLLIVNQNIIKASAP